mmetsp:Transcript_12489/g.38106  ORF Transcript_12489/g.38106 Transcript_12489/m.38106 type:complete len:303 (+) Transcript_12489:2680-3588(+)
MDGAEVPNEVVLPAKRRRAARARGGVLGASVRDGQIGVCLGDPHAALRLQRRQNKLPKVGQKPPGPVHRHVCTQRQEWRAKVAILRHEQRKVVPERAPPVVRRVDNLHREGKPVRFRLLFLPPLQLRRTDAPELPPRAAELTVPAHGQNVHGGWFLPLAAACLTVVSSQRDRPKQLAFGGVCQVHKHFVSKVHVEHAPERVRAVAVGTEHDRPHAVWRVTRLLHKQTRLALSQAPVVRTFRLHHRQHVQHHCALHLPLLHVQLRAVGRVQQPFPARLRQSTAKPVALFHHSFSRPPFDCQTP